ncbi:MAG: 50S ribosomal protein L7/L12 [Symploca sp. SIO2C1]|nr:50S ribosomal protein L7/L12 [Symploca sp. SIO2C1]
MSTKTQAIFKQLQSLNIMEVAELIKQIEEGFGVTISVVKTFSYSPDPVNLASGNSSESSKLNVILEELPTHQEIAILKMVKSLTSLDLRETQEFGDSVPTVFKEAVAIKAAEDVKKHLEAASAKISLN